MFMAEDYAAGRPAFRNVLVPNIVLDEGAQLVASLLSGGDVAAPGGIDSSAWKQSTGKAFIGVADQSADPVATDTGFNLTGGETSHFKAVDSGFPSYDSDERYLIYRATFISGEGEIEWKMMTLNNTNDDATGCNLNVAVVDDSDVCIKQTGQVWEAWLYVAL